MTAYFWVAVGGAIGSLARYWCSGWIARYFGETFPWGTLSVNVLGSLLIGFFAALSAPESRWFLPPLGRQFLMIGVCGGFTTFSSFSLQTWNQLEAGEWPQALFNMLSSMLLCLLAVILGHMAATYLNSMSGE